MLKKIKRNAWNIVRKFLSRNGEYFFLIEKSKDNVLITEAKINTKRRTVFVINQDSASSTEDFRRPLIPADKLILALDDLNATTVEKKITVKRDSLKNEITKEESEQLLFQAFWSFMNEFRSWSAKKMGVPELDLLLSSVAVTGISIDKKNIIRLEGVCGKEVSFLIRGTFISRSILKTLEKLKKWANEIIIIEKDFVFSILEKTEDKNVVCVGKEETSNIFFSNNNECRFHKKIQWGIGTLSTSLCKKLLIDEEISSEIIKRYAENNISKNIENYLKNEINFELQNLLNLIDENSIIFFPYKDSEKIHGWFEKKPHVKTVKISNEISKIGFFVKNNNVSLYTCLLFLYQFTTSENQELNQLLKRRAKWLIAQIS